MNKCVVATSNEKDITVRYSYHLSKKNTKSCKNISPSRCFHDVGGDMGDARKDPTRDAPFDVGEV